MRRVIIKGFGGPDVLEIETSPVELQAGPGQLVVDVEAAGINYLDVYQREGKGLHSVGLPFSPGLEGVGRIHAIGSDVSGSHYAIGQRVAWMNVPGSYTDRLLMSATQAIPVPDSFSVPECLLFQALTAQYLASEYRTIQPGDRVLIHAAAGGVGQLLVQWMKHLGAWVVGSKRCAQPTAVQGMRLPTPLAG